jgi:hypothetical protein
MKPTEPLGHSRRIMAVFVLACALLAGCRTQGQTTALIAGTAAWGAYAPSQEIQQIHYLGVFDPAEQVPPTVYRVRVRGQASFLCFTKFASGWVPAEVVDSLGKKIEFEGNGYGVSMTAVENAVPEAKLTPGKGLFVAGPEGFRPVPKNSRLVIMMGADASGFFEGIQTALGNVTAASLEKRDEDLNRLIFEALVSVKAERERLTDLQENIASDAYLEKEAQP